MCIYVSKVMRNFAVKKLVAHFLIPFLWLYGLATSCAKFYRKQTLLIFFIFFAEVI